MLNCHVDLKLKEEYHLKNDCYVTASSGWRLLACLKMAASGKHKVIPNFTQFPKGLLKSSLCAIHEPLSSFKMHEPFSSFKMQISLQDTNFTLGYKNFEFKHILKTLDRWLMRVCIKVFLKLLSCLDIIIFQVRSGRTTRTTDPTPSLLTSWCWYHHWCKRYHSHIISYLPGQGVYRLSTCLIVLAHANLQDSS